MTEHERRQAVDRVLDHSYRFHSERPTSGLIELQKFYMKVFGNEQDC